MNFDLASGLLSQEKILESSNAERQHLENKIIASIVGKDSDPPRQKVAYYNEVLSPIVKEIEPYSPLPTLESQLSALTGIWQPLWTTMPFQDLIPGRIREQSYQIFGQSNYYANVARYFPTKGIRWLKRFVSPAYDLMILQRFKISNSQWMIQNIGVKQVIHRRNIWPLTSEKAQEWFENLLGAELANNVSNPTWCLEEPEWNQFNQKWHRRLKTTYKAKPFFKHVYMSPDLRIVESRRESNQRPSYTIAAKLPSTWERRF